MTTDGKPNEEHHEEEELVVTDHRDEETENVSPSEQPSQETTYGDVVRALEQFGEDVASSPEQRATQIPPDTESLQEDTPEAEADPQDPRS